MLASGLGVAACAPSGPAGGGLDPPPPAALAGPLSAPAQIVAVTSPSQSPAEQASLQQSVARTAAGTGRIWRMGVDAPPNLIVFVGDLPAGRTGLRDVDRPPVLSSRARLATAGRCASTLVGEDRSAVIVGHVPLALDPADRTACARAIVARAMSGP